MLVAQPEVDEHLQIIRGKVLFHSKSRDEIDRADADLHPTDAAIIYTGRIPDDAVVVL